MEVSDSLSAVHCPWMQPCHGQLQIRPAAAADHPPWTLKGSALVPQLVPWREVRPAHSSQHAQHAPRSQVGDGSPHLEWKEEGAGWGSFTYFDLRLGQ